MSQFRSLLRVAGISVGVVGLVLCAAAMFVLWMVSIRIGQITETMFGKADRSLGAVQQWVVKAQDRVAAAKISTDDLEKTLRNWAGREVGQRLAVQLDAAEKAERLASALRQADNWLEVSESSIGLVESILSIHASTGVPTDTPRINELQEEIASLRSRLAEATELVSNIHDRLTGADDENSVEARAEQAIQFALRVVATLGSVDDRLEKVADRFSAAQGELLHVAARTQRWRLLVTIAVAALIVWMAAGQVALCRLAWA